LPGACGRDRSPATSQSPPIPPAGSGSAGACLAVQGFRDIASGLFVFIFMASLATHVLGGLMLAATIIPVMDWVVMLTHHGPEATAYGVHRATAVLMLATAAPCWRHLPDHGPANYPLFLIGAQALQRFGGAMMSRRC
jgi:hypothetical protein